MHSYLKDAAAIYEQSFAIIEAEADLARFDAFEKLIAMRMIHACGAVEIAGDIEISKGAFDAGAAALKNGKPIICDVTMVQRGVIARALPQKNQVLCEIGAAAQMAQQLATTRSAAAMELLKDKIEGSIVLIGNAPTALFYLIDGLAAGWPKPALIIGAPVGFVGAMESKKALAEANIGVPFVTIHGRMGGSAITAAALNAIALHVSNVGQNLAGGL